jgi:hypothetical protein
MSKVTWMYRDPETWEWTTKDVPVFDSQQEAEWWLSQAEKYGKDYFHSRLVDAE